MQTVTVWTEGRSRRGGIGRYHLAAACQFMAKPKLRRARALEEATALGYWLCPYCAPQPPCCATGQCAGYALPRLERAETPEWEDEVEGRLDATD